MLSALWKQRERKVSRVFQKTPTKKLCGKIERESLGKRVDTLTLTLTLAYEPRREFDYGTIQYSSRLPYVHDCDLRRSKLSV